MNGEITRGAEMFDTIRTVFSGSLDVRFQPEQSASEKETVIGILKNPIAKVFFSEAKEIALQMKDVLKEHNVSHELGVVDSTACDAVEAKIKDLKILQGLHSRLFWEGVYSEFPRFGSGIRSEWKVVALDGAYQPLAFDHESPALTFFKDVCDAFRATDDTIFPSDLDINPVNEENEEFILGKLALPALKALFMVKVGLNRAVDKVAREVLSPSAESPVDALKSMSVKCARLKEQIDFVDKLFWLGVEKQFPSVAEGSNFALRRGWNIVRIPKDIGPDPYLLASLDILRRCMHQD
ncbi:MAG: hypothetical protein WCP24_01020 [bacterium]